MKKVSVLLFLLFGMSANAATMCVPDLSTCDSCTGGAYSGLTWSATCCGVDVAGVVLPTMVSGVLTGSLFRLEESSWLSTLCATSGNTTGVVCVMTKPFFVQNGYVPVCVRGADFINEAAQKCAQYFRPKCVFSDCGVPPYCESSGGAD